MTSEQESQLWAALQEANIPVLLLVLHHLTGDERWLAEPYAPTPTVASDDNDTGGHPAELQAEIRAAAFEVIRGQLGSPEPVTPLSEAETLRALSVSLGETVLPEYAGSMLEESGLRPRLDRIAWTSDRPSRADDFPVIVIGAGMAGIATGVYLDRLGLEYQILERGDDVGGVWRENAYPGAGVDTPCHLYSYSFAQRPSWSRYYAKQEEILNYFRDVAERFGVVERVRFGHRVATLTWDEGSGRWTVCATDADGREHRFVAAVVISCVGLLNEPQVAAVPGADDFEGPAFHSAEWPQDLDLTDRRVAVIGTGASAVQIVPAIADVAKDVTVFQRSPQWLLPNPNYLRETSRATQWLMEHVPTYMAYYRMRLIWMWQDKLLASLHRDPDWAHPERSVNAVNERHRAFIERYVRAQLGDRDDLWDQVVPDYPPYGKRVLMDNRWFEAIQRDDVTLVPHGAQRLEKGAVVSEDGVVHPADVVVWATGFKATEMLRSLEVVGRGGMSLHEVWGVDNPFAYLGLTVPGFPNFFVVGGPNTFLGHGGSAIFTTECGITYIMRTLVEMLEHDVASIDVLPEVADAYARNVDELHEGLIWTHPGMTTWWRNSRGRVVVASPWRGVDYWAMTWEADLSVYRCTPLADVEDVWREAAHA
ncbi:flavin-containing monooxygenase [Micromonospora inositola]|uniref:4-hydroxyacetophenone monooxygenase n=1 Tax=Micromonospora inositola TaxID=47865 RepID=A0A1C5JN15_9ACTN|nr:NAD(P)/FAD-dependent oxidoreductase [Micromonospora inositola]SCG71975.1 4-hydroxyacetophenone monooxygenase [Micromonospora inositola]